MHFGIGLNYILFKGREVFYQYRYGNYAGKACDPIRQH